MDTKNSWNAIFTENWLINLYPYIYIDGSSVCIVDVCQTIRSIRGIFERVRQSTRRCCEACILAGTSHWEHFP